MNSLVQVQTCPTGVGSKQLLSSLRKRFAGNLDLCTITVGRRQQNERDANRNSQDLGDCSNSHLNRRRHRLPQESQRHRPQRARSRACTSSCPHPPPPSLPILSLLTSVNPSSSTGAPRTPPRSPSTALATSNTNGTQTVAPSTSTNFHLTAKGDGGTTEANVRVTVRVPVAPTAPPADS